MTKHLADIAAEGVLIAGGARAILLQVANPAVGRGVARHSDFASGPMQRLRSTLTYVYLLVYGSEGEFRRSTRLVNHAHTDVHGSGYTAFDPQLQLWVAATLYDTAISIYETVFGVLEPEEAEAIYREYAIIGAGLQMPRELWPADRAAFRQYWDQEVAQLHVDEESRHVALDLLQPGRVPLWLKASMPLARLVTAGLLTAEQRAMYDLPWSDRRQRRFERTLRVIAGVYPHLPKRLRHWPKNHYLRAFRADRG